MMVKYLMAFCLAVLLSGCAGQQDSQQNSAQPKISAPFSAGAITVKLNARPDLNQVNGMANSCTIVILQAAKAGTLDRVLSNPAKVKALFAGSGADAENGDAVLQVDRYTIMPGQTTTLHIDRAMQTRHVALVAGYYPFPGKQHQVREDIPVRRYRTGWLSPVWHSELSPLFLAVTLGGAGVVSTEDNVQKSQVPDVSPPGMHQAQATVSGRGE